jgi:hypothetical protein
MKFLKRFEGWSRNITVEEYLLENEDKIHHLKDLLQDLYDNNIECNIYISHPELKYGYKLGNEITYHDKIPINHSEFIVRIVIHAGRKVYKENKKNIENFISRLDSYGVQNLKAKMLNYNEDKWVDVRKTDLIIQDSNPYLFAMQVEFDSNDFNP